MPIWLCGQIAKLKGERVGNLTLYIPSASVGGLDNPSRCWYLVGTRRSGLWNVLRLRRKG